MATKSKTSTARTSTRKSTSTKTAVAAAPSAITPASISSVDTQQHDMADLPIPEDGPEPAKQKELVDMAVERSGVKKRDAKPAIEAALAIMGEMVAEGRDLNLPGFGKFKVKRMKKDNNGQIMHARLRQPDNTGNSDPTPLATAAE